MSAHPAWWTNASAPEGNGGARGSAAAVGPLPLSLAPPGRQPFPAPVPVPGPAAPRGEGAPRTADAWDEWNAPWSADDTAGAWETEREPGEADAVGFVTFPLADAPDAPATARALTRTTLRDWGQEALVDDASVIVSELVTNALRYGLPADGPRTPFVPHPPASPAEPILLSLVHYGDSVLCAVFDPSRDVPVVREPDYLTESGRGLHVLEALSRNWGWTTPDRHGKAVWALLPAEEEAIPAERPTGGSPAPAERLTGAEADGAGAAAGTGTATGSDVPGSDAASEPLTRLLLLLELLSGPSWLRALGSAERADGPEDARNAPATERRRGDAQ